MIINMVPFKHSYQFIFYLKLNINEIFVVTKKTIETIRELSSRT